MIARVLEMSLLILPQLLESLCNYIHCAAASFAALSVQCVSLILFETACSLIPRLLHGAEQVVFRGVMTIFACCAM